MKNDVSKKRFFAKNQPHMARLVLTCIEKHIGFGVSLMRQLLDTPQKLESKHCTHYKLQDQLIIDL